MAEQPEKMDLNSMDIAAENRARLKAMFPAVFTESRNEKGEPVEAVDLEKLKAEIGTFSDLYDARRERYGMDWPGKKEAMKLIQQPSAATLKPCREESVNFDTTGNLFIEGDNLEVLKLLQKSYYGKVKMIYIDPPYNTGKEFIYPDNFSESLETYLEYAGLIDGEGKRFSTNTPNEGRFHTKWLNMMYPRLYLARNLLREDGVLFLSIDDHEVTNLKTICNDIFGEENYLVQFAWRTDGDFDNQAKIKICHEYILCYGKSIDQFPAPPVIDPNTSTDSKLYNEEIRNTIVKNGPRNPISEIKLPKGFPADFEVGTINMRNDSWPHYLSDAIVSNRLLTNEVVVKSGWSSKDLLDLYIINGCVPIVDSKGQETTFTISKTGAIEVIKKRVKNQSHVISVLNNLGGTQKATAEMEELDIIFDDYPKPTALIKYLLQMNYGSGNIIMDFFSGSCTTAHAVLNLNNENSCNHKFIMVQLPEPCKADSKALKAGYKTIADIGKERIRRVIKKIQDEQAVNKKKEEGKLPGMEEREEKEIDLGFKVLKLDRSNFKPWQRLEPQADVKQIERQLFDHIEHIHAEAEPEGILYELLLKTGFMPTVKIEQQQMAGKEVYSIDGGALWICLEEEITKDLINKVAEARPCRFICLDRGFKGNDQLKANAAQTFKAYNQDKERSEQIVFRTV